MGTSFQLGSVTVTHCCMGRPVVGEITVYGSYTWVWGLEITGEPHEGVNVLGGDGIKLINLVLHDNFVPLKPGAPLSPTGQGIGAALWEHAMERATALGATLLEIEADPNAEGFYLKMGATTIGEVAYVLEGQRRRLPLMQARVRQRVIGDMYRLLTHSSRKL